MPKYFSAATQYINFPITLDVERRPTHKHMRTPSYSRRSNDTRTNTAGTNTPRTDTPQAPRPTLSRTPSGGFSVTNSRPSTPSQARTPGRAGRSTDSISGSNISIDFAAAEARLSGPRFQGRINPLRMSPIIPFSPPIPLRLSLQRVGPGSYTRKPSDASGIIPPRPRRPQTPVSTKPLPLTPFPLGTGR